MLFTYGCCLEWARTGRTVPNIENQYVGANVDIVTTTNKWMCGKHCCCTQFSQLACTRRTQGASTCGSEEGRGRWVKTGESSGCFSETNWSGKLCVFDLETKPTHPRITTPMFCTAALLFSSTVKGDSTLRCMSRSMFLQWQLGRSVSQNQTDSMI